MFGRVGDGQGEVETEGELKGVSSKLRRNPHRFK